MYAPWQAQNALSYGIVVAAARKGEHVYAKLGAIALVLVGGLTACAHDAHDAQCGTAVTVFLETSEVLDEVDHHYYDDLTAQLKKEDPTHLRDVKSSWGTQRSVDNKAAFVEATLAGDQHESTQVVHNIVEHSPPPTFAEEPGKTYYKKDTTYVIGPCHSLEGEAAWERHLAGTAPGQPHVSTPWT
jgi:hypothetical protein